MSRRSAHEPLWASLVRVNLYAFCPKVSKPWQSGMLSPFPSISREELWMPFQPFDAGGGAGGGTAAWSGPPITSSTVLTTVPCAARGWSQSRNASTSDGSTQLVSHALHNWWKTIVTQPPPAFSAAVTAFLRSVRLLLPDDSMIA